MTAELELTQGYVARIDDDDLDRAQSAGRWAASVKPGAVYALRAARRADGGQTTIRLHNFLTGWPFVDHVNGDGLDNRRANLRPATQAQNVCNRGATVLNRSGYKGVCWHARAGKWTTQISVAGRRIYLGLFSDLSEAARAYDRAAIDLHGSFAHLNFPQEPSE